MSSFRVGSSADVNMEDMTGWNVNAATSPFGGASGAAYANAVAEEYKRLKEEEKKRQSRPGAPPPMDDAYLRRRAQERVEAGGTTPSGGAGGTAADDPNVGTQVAVDAYSTASDGVQSGLNFAVDQYGNMVDSTNTYTSNINQFIADTKKKSDDFNAGLSSYIAGATNNLTQDRAAYEEAAKKRDEANAKITEQLQAAYEQLQGMKPDSKEYQAYKEKLTALEQGLVNDPYGKELDDLYSGKKPSAAEMLLKKAQEEALNQQLSMTASARGGVNYAALARTASNNIVTQNAKAAQDAAILRAQEQERMLGMILQKQQSDRNQQIQLAGMGFQADVQKQAADLQWMGAVNQVGGQQAAWQGQLGQLVAADASTRLGFSQAGNALMGLGIQGAGVTQGYSSMGLNAMNAGQAAITNTMNAGMNLGTTMSNAAMGLGNMGVGLGLGLAGVANDSAATALQTRIHNDALDQSRRDYNLRVLGTLLSAGSAVGAAYVGNK